MSLQKFLRNFPLAVFALFVLSAASVKADTITIAGIQTGNLATATAVCEFNAQTNTFTFTITNTSAITAPGSTSTITGIGFDLPPTGNASASGLNGFTGLQAPSLSSTFNFSDGALGNVPANLNNVVLDFGFTTGASGTFAGGSVGDGLAPGESASFTVTGAAFTGFTESEICNSIFVRFQAVGVPPNNDLSDVGVPGGQIPEPTSMLLLGTGLLGVARLVRNRTKKG